MSAGDERVEVPPDRLDAGVLRRLVEELVTRSGTDYGGRERSLEEKVADVMARIARREAVILFDPEQEIVEIVLRETR